jgi:hypothetical protein
MDDNLEKFGTKCNGLILRHYRHILPVLLRKTIKNVSQDSQSPGRDLNKGTPEYKAGVLTT